MRICNDVLEVIGRSVVDGNKLFLTGQLDRQLYVKVDKVLKAAGGQWNRKEKAHVFNCDAEVRIQQMLETGDIEVPRDFDYFPTPETLAVRLKFLAGIGANTKVLEPSAGQGAIAKVIHNAADNVSLDMYELMQSNVDFLKGLNLERGSVYGPVNFLEVDHLPIYDAVVMNPPFGKQADIDHVMHAFEFLKPGGRLVSIMSASILFRDNKKTQLFRQFISERGGKIEPLPEGSFKESRTMVRTVVVIIDK